MEVCEPLERERLQIKYTVAAIATTESWTCVHRAKGPTSGSMYAKYRSVPNLLAEALSD
jgi:hypothetical protein